MRGEFIGVWEETYREIWNPLLQQEAVPSDVYSALYQELYEAIGDTPGVEFSLQINDAIQLREAFDRALTLAGVVVGREEADGTYAAVDQPDVTARRAAIESALANLIGDSANAAHALNQALRELASEPVRRAEARERALGLILNEAGKSQEAFEEVRASMLIGERAIVTFLESVFDILEEYGGDALSNPYFNLLTTFIEKFSLRYDLRRPCLLCPTLPGVFNSLVRDLKEATIKDVHLNGLMKDYEEAIRDLRTDCSDTRIKTCMVKQINLLEAMGSSTSGVTAKTVGQICNQVGTWPHESIKQSMKSLYEFTCDYPGIRHAGTPASALRAIEMRDMVAMSILLTGFIPYLSDKVNSETVYWRS